MIEALRARASAIAALAIARLARLAKRPLLRAFAIARLAKRPRRRALGMALAVVLFPFAALALAAVLAPMPPELRETGAGSSVRVTDRDGHLLREVRSDDGVRARWVPLEECGAAVPQALIAAEDRRFASHHGVDWLAMVRAAWSDLRARRVVSGGSTITMQLARAVRPHPRTLRGKLLEMALALRIEASLSKRQILEQYLNRVTFGPNLRGIAAASQAYFDAPPSVLSRAEAALLVGMARGPSYYELTRHPDRALRRRDRVLERMRDAGSLSAESYETATREPLALQSRGVAFGAPHFVRAVVAGSLSPVQPGLADALRGAPDVDTTIDASLQSAVEAAAGRVVAELASKHVTAAAAIAVDNATGDVLAYVGSPDMFDAAHGGQNDGVRALRQPGSALKPFLYALALEDLGWTAATLLPDVEVHLATSAGDFAPRDYDQRFRGPVRLREALGNSLNVPAVWAAQQVGVERLLEKLRALGFDSLDRAPEYYGPALALGDGEVTLLELVRAYSTLARDGEAQAMRVVRSVRGPAGHVVTFDPAPRARVLSREAAAQITDALRDHEARRGSFGERNVLDFDFDVAAKTGTSKGYRDNWAVGFTREVTVGAWVGNFDGTPMVGTSGISGAGPLFHAVMEAAMRGRPRIPLALAQRPPVDSLERVEVCALSGGAPGPGCTHRVAEWMPAEEARALAPCAFHERVRIDRRNGLVAGPACDDADVVERDFERYPAPFTDWARVAGRPIAPDEASPFCPADVPSPEGELRIANVRDGARFALDPDRPPSLQRLDVRVAAPPAARRVRLRIDGEVLGEAGPPYAFAWPLTAGEHVLVAEADGLPPSPGLRVSVRGL
jgi:penicillin-binding protein 1C